MATHSSILAWKFHGQRSLVGYSLWDCKEYNTTECTHTHTHISFCALVDFEKFQNELYCFFSKIKMYF